MHKLYLQREAAGADADTRKAARADFLQKCLKKHGIYNYQIRKNVYGKSYLTNCKLFFNTSHSGDWLAVVVADREVGVDIQKLTFRPRVVERFFTAKEQALAKTASAFTQIWTMKEAYVKMLGIGIGYGLKKVNTLKLAPRFHLLSYGDYQIAVIEGGQ